MIWIISFNWSNEVVLFTIHSLKYVCQNSIFVGKLKVDLVCYSKIILWIFACKNLIPNTVLLNLEKAEKKKKQDGEFRNGENLEL